MNINTASGPSAHALDLAQIVKDTEGRMLTLDYQDGCKPIDPRHLRTISGLITELQTTPRVKVWQFMEGFAVELERKPDGLEQWTELNLQHRPGRITRREMAIIMVLGVRWVEYGVESITVGL